MSKIKSRPAWKPIRPLIATIGVPGKFPTNALGPILGPATRAIARAVQASEGVVAQSVLAASTLAAQGLADVRRGSTRHPISNYFIVIADSGERKSATKAIAFKEVRNREARLKAKCLEELSQEDKGAAVPVEVLHKSTIMWGDVSLDGILNSLAFGYPSPGIVTDEGGNFLGGLAMHADNVIRTISVLSEIHTTGELPPSNRAPGGRLGGRLGGRKIRLLLYLMLQPLLADKLFSNRQFWSQGIFSRFLCVRAPSLAGSRIYERNNSKQDPCVKKYHQQIRKLLRMQLRIGDAQ